MDDLTIRAHRFIAETPSMLAAVRLADLTDEKRPTNVPGTSDSYPNWQPMLSLPIEDLSELPLLKAISAAMNDGRKREPHQRPTSKGAMLRPEGTPASPQQSGLPSTIAKLEVFIRDRPLKAVAIAAALGLVFGLTR